MSLMTLTHPVRLSDGSVIPAGTRYQMIEAPTQDEELGLAGLGFTAMLVETGQRVFLTEIDLHPEWVKSVGAEVPAFLSRLNGAFARLVGRKQKSERDELADLMDAEGVAPATEPLPRVRRR